MKHPVYAVRDVKGTFWTPQVDQNDAAAIRNFAMMVNNPSGVVGFAPSDFELYKVAEFDSEVGTLTPIEPIQFVVNGLSVAGAKYEK